MYGDDSNCRQYYAKLSELPHAKLVLSRVGFISLWDGKQSDGCEVAFETDESMVSGDVVFSKFQSFTHTQGWSVNEKLIADGPGSTTVAIENAGKMCLMYWSQHSWIDEEISDIEQSDQIRIVIQCAKIQP